jgi:hypothetical protein
MAWKGIQFLLQVIDHLVRIIEVKNQFVSTKNELACVELFFHSYKVNRI